MSPVNDVDEAFVNVCFAENELIVDVENPVDITDPVTTIGYVPDTVACLLLNVDQSVEDNAPLFKADAVGRLNIIVLVVVEMLKSVPVVLVLNVKVVVATPLIVVVENDPDADVIVIVSFAPGLFFVSVIPVPATSLLNK